MSAGVAVEEEEKGEEEEEREGEISPFNIQFLNLPLSRTTNPGD